MEDIVLNVKGMMCEGCENRIKNVLKNIDGVKDVSADHTTGKVTISISKNIEEKLIYDVIDDIGYEVVKEG